MIRIRSRWGSPRARKIAAARWQASRSRASGLPPCSSAWQLAAASIGFGAPAGGDEPRRLGETTAFGEMPAFGETTAFGEPVDRADDAWLDRFAIARIHTVKSTIKQSFNFKRWLRDVKTEHGSSAGGVTASACGISARAGGTTPVDSAGEGRAMAEVPAIP